MTELAKYAFLPWLRRGVATEIFEADTLGAELPAQPAIQRVQLGVTLKLKDVGIQDGSPTTTEISQTVQLIGPGDIAGIHRNAVVRVEPRDQVATFEPNCFPFIEFYEEDFPWRYSPAAPVPAAAGGAKLRLRPWILLLVLEESEFTLRPNEQGLPCVSVNADQAGRVLYPQTQTWAWAHVHAYQALASGPDTPDLIREVNQRLQADPDQAVSRVMCPRRLEPDKNYTAVLVPAFETGRLAGLQLDPGNTPAQEPSWRTDGPSDPGRARPLDFPVYYQWSFRTSDHGDFKSLAMLLTARPFGPEFGKRALDITSPGYGLESAAPGLESGTLGLEGALKPPELAGDPWPNGPGDAAYREQLKNLLNAAAGMQSAAPSAALPLHPYYPAGLDEDPILMPPIYGQHHARAERLGAPGHPAWVETLNLDPRHRVAAGLGARVVQDQQESLMEAAWKQIGQVNAANQKIREAELARQVHQSMLDKRVKTRDANPLLQLTAPLHKRLANSGLTLHQTLAQSRIPGPATSPAFRKVLRPGRKVLRRMNRAAATPETRIQSRVVERFNLQPGQPLALTAALPKAVPDMAVTLDALGQAVDAAVLDFQQHRSLAQHGFMEVLDELQLPVLDLAALKLALDRKFPDLPIRTLAYELADGIRAYVRQNGNLTVTEELAVFIKFFGKTVTGKSLGTVLVQRPLGRKKNPRVTPLASQDEVRDYQAGFQSFQNEVTAKSRTDLPRPSLSDLTSLGGQLKQSLEPGNTLVPRVLSTLKVWSGARQAFVPLTVLEPILAYPEFPQAMFEPLCKLSQDFILPNCGQIPPNSLTLLRNNPVFIEAFLAGLNHEMGRELLWREYPTDQRGTYFKKFWNTHDNLVSQGSGDEADIQPLHQWQGDLGQNSLKSDELLVLAVRGELLLKYPNTVVYAQRAQFTQAGRPRTLGSNPDIQDPQAFRFPVFQASLDPDIQLFGFALGADEARGNDSDPGWFFIFKERPGQPKFGLDEAEPSAAPAGNLFQLTWGNVSPSASPAFADLSQVHVDGSLQPVWAALNSADWAAYTFREPILLARHASEMLPRA